MSLGSTIALAAEHIVKPIEGMQRAIAKPWYAALGAVGRPVQLVQETVTGVVYGSIRLGAALIGVAVDSRVAPDSPTAETATAVANGLWGDTLGERRPSLHTPMSLRDNQGQPIDVGPDLADSFPDATGHLVVLVHGLVQTERCWNGTEAEPGLHDVLETHAGITPVAVRYNTGLPVATSGVQLASLLDRIHASWPVPVETISVVGHSMGGLVVRSACAAAVRAGQRWIADTTDVVTIASPHRGAPLEKLAAAAARGLRAAPQTRPLADFVDSRSQGIKDLRFGSIGLDPSTEAATAEALAGINHHFAAGVITSDPAHPVGAIVGDLMVRPASSTGAPSLEPINVVVLGGKHHANLLHDGAVIGRVVEWLVPRDELMPGDSGAE